MGIVEFSLIGAVVGLLVGLTGVGGGSIMTPLLLMFGIPPQIAIGTDLLYASITKSSGLLAHQKQGHIRWEIVKYMAMGSIPASIVTAIILLLFKDSAPYTQYLTQILGAMLIFTAIVLLVRNKLAKSSKALFFQENSNTSVLVMGVILGVLVTLSSVGAGAIGTAVLLLLYPALASKYIVGTDIAHAVPLTLIAGLGHLGLGHVDFNLLGGLLIGSIPATVLGSMLSSKIPSSLLRYILIIILLTLGIKFTLGL